MDVCSKTNAFGPVTFGQSFGTPPKPLEFGSGCAFGTPKSFKFDLGGKGSAFIAPKPAQEPANPFSLFAKALLPLAKPVLAMRPDSRDLNVAIANMEKYDANIQDVTKLKMKMSRVDDSLNYIALLEKEVVVLKARMKRNENTIAAMLKTVNAASKMIANGKNAKK